MENYWIKQARINIRVNISWLDPSGFNTTAYVSVKSTWSSCWAESEHFHGFFLQCAGTGGDETRHISFFFVWMIKVLMRFSTGCDHAGYLACMSCPLLQRGRHTTVNCHSCGLRWMRMAGGFVVCGMILLFISVIVWRYVVMQSNETAK